MGLKLLSDRVKNIVRLKMKGLKNSEIAHELKISESAVSQSLHEVADTVESLNDSLDLLRELGLWPDRQGLKLLRPATASKHVSLPPPITLIHRNEI